MDSVNANARDIDALKFGVEKSLRYHQRRRAHYEGLHSKLMLGVILSGSAAFGGLLKPEFLGLFGAALGALDLVFSFSIKAREHDFLYRRFSELLKEIVAKRAPTVDDHAQWIQRRLDIEADEPPVYWALEASCDNEMTLALGRGAQGLVKLGFWQRLLMHWYRFETAEMPRSAPLAHT